MPGGGAGFVVDVQADLLADLATRVVVPLVAEANAPKPISDLNPTITINGEVHVLLTQAIASIARRELKPTIASLTSEHDRIIRALDLLLVGF